MMQFIDIQKSWRKLGPIYRSKEARSVWQPDMDAYRRLGFGAGVGRELPSRYESPFWERYEQREDGRRGPDPAFWDYVCGGACHFLVNLSLFVAQTACPDRPWRIVTSGVHSTLWDGERTLWDPVAMFAYRLTGDVTADRAWKNATDEVCGGYEIIAPGKRLSQKRMAS